METKTLQQTISPWGLIGQMVKEDETVRVKAVPNRKTLPGIEIRSYEIHSTRNNGHKFNRDCKNCRI
jgi:hypothetical protein